MNSIITKIRHLGINAMIKNTIKIIISTFGYEINKPSPYPEINKSFDVLDYIIFRKLAKNQKFSFVQVGANDGILADNLNPLIRKYGLQGVLIEPLEDVFNDLKKNYIDQPQLRFSNCAIGLKNETIYIHRFKRNAPVPHGFFHGLARIDGEYIKNRAKKEGLESFVEEVAVKMLTFDRFAESHSITHINLLYVDTEGYDRQVIESVFNANFLPEIINYEWTEMSDKDRYELKILLREKKYSFITLNSDVICVREDAA